MYNADILPNNELPSHRQLVKSTIVALIVATFLMLTVVLPAEFGRDPTGVGSLLGLTKMGQIKQSLAKEAALEEQSLNQAGQVQAQTSNVTQVIAAEPVVNVEKPTSTTSEPDKQTAAKSDEITVMLEPDEGTEIKVTLRKGEKVNYQWVSTGKTNYDIHGDSAEDNIDYFGYSKGSKVSDEGEIVAEFNGNHGWFWRNRTNDPITITLKTVGQYSDIKHME